MSEEAVVLTYRQKPIIVTAIQWQPALGAVHGVRARSKKHESNPDEFYLVDRFHKEHLIQPGDWVVTNPDGSHMIVQEGAFQTLYEQDVLPPNGPVPVAEPPPGARPAVQVGAGEVNEDGVVEGGVIVTLVPPDGSEGTRTASGE